MKKGDIFEGKVIRTEFPNKGIIDIEGQKVIVKNALEGQVVRFSINKKRRDKVEGRLPVSYTHLTLPTNSRV